MDAEMVKRLIDGCFEGKKAVETMPELPKGLKPRHIHVIESIEDISTKKDSVFVSDVSRQLNITTPSVTKLIQELVEKGAVEKKIDANDKRYFTVSLTKLGKKYYVHYVKEYHDALAKELDELTPEEAEVAIRAIHMLYEGIKKLERENKEHE